MSGKRGATRKEERGGQEKGRKRDVKLRSSVKANHNIRIKADDLQETL